MAPSKRKEAASPARNAKKAKKDPVAEKLQHQLREVLAALDQADISKDLEKMIEVVLPLSLGQFCDQRHKYQERVAEGIGEILGEVDAALRKEVETKRTERDTATAGKPQVDQAAAEASSKLDAKIAEVHSLKVTLAGKAVAFREAKAALAEAEEAKVTDGIKSREAEEKKNDFLSLVEALDFLKTHGDSEEEVKKKSAEIKGNIAHKEKALSTLLKRYKFEESMLIALPAALRKAPDQRGQFDLMVISQLESELQKRLAEQDALLAAALPGQEKCDAAIKAAEERLAAAKGEQRTAAQAFDKASAEQAECEAASSAAQKAVRDNTQLSKKLQKALLNAEVEVELFEQGPRETFKSLRERSTPPPEVEEEAPVAETAADEAVAMDTAEPEVPVVAATA